MVKELIKRWYHRQHYIEDEILRKKFQIVGIIITIVVVIIHTFQIVYFILGAF